SSVAFTAARINGSSPRREHSQRVRRGRPGAILAGPIVFVVRNVVTFTATLLLTIVPVLDTSTGESRSTRDAFREGTFGRRSECGACGRRICAPLPGGSGPPLGRHYDRSPRSAVDL